MTREQYIEGLKKLSPKHLEILKAIYYSPRHSCRAIELAEILNYKSFHGANRQVGAIGESFSKIDGVKTKIYYDKSQIRTAYFELIGPYTDDGWVMHRELCQAMEYLMIVSPSEKPEAYGDRLPTELYDFEKDYYVEGKAIQVIVNRYERDTKARLVCLKHYGFKCKICDFDFQAVYGDIANGFIQVHHIKPLSEINKEYQIDPINDLIPVCANCHSVIHLTRPALKIEEIKKLMRKSSR